MFMFLFQVNELIKEFNREDLCVWGSRMSTVVDKLYKSVSRNVCINYKMGEPVFKVFN